MSKIEAQEILGITAMDEVLKTGLEDYKESLVKMLELVKDKDERTRIRTNIKAINTLLRLGAYEA